MRALFYALAAATLTLTIVLLQFPAVFLNAAGYGPREYSRDVSEKGAGNFTHNATGNRLHEYSREFMEREKTFSMLSSEVENDLNVTQHAQSMGNKVTTGVLSDGLYGVRKRGKNYLLVYNNVPKCGSRSLATSIGNILKRNGNYRGIKVKGNKRNREDLNKSFQNVKTPAYISGHMPLAIPQRPGIVYINMVRDPIERFISTYYFSLYGDQSGVRPEEGRQRRNQNIDEYIEAGGPVNTNIFFHFDDQDSNVSDIDTVVERAKANIDRYFILIGLTEEMEATIKLLGKLLPDLLHGIIRVYKNTISEKRQGYTTKNKVPPSNRTRSILREKLSAEYELYFFVKQRFVELKTKYGVT